MYYSYKICLMHDTTRKIIRKFFFVLKQLLFIALDITVILMAVAAAIFIYIYVKTPIADRLDPKNIPQTTIIYDRTGQHELYDLHGRENRKLLTHDQIPDTIRIATIATEDANFYHHIGIDFLAIARALKTDIENKNMDQGASTITQQLARNVFLSPDKTIRRKLIEAVIAIKIEHNYTKEQILDMYLNEIPYGSNIYGIETASETYFGKPAKDLTLDEAALLAAIPKATSYYSPYGDHKNDLAARQKEILARIAKLKLADRNDVTAAEKVDTIAKVIPHKNTIIAPHFVFYVKDVLENLVGQRKAEEGGLKVYTTLDYDKQKLAENILKNAAATTLKQYGASNAALVSIDPKNGQILDMVGSVDYYNSSIDGQVNVAIRPRQPGSSFKPFVYAAAFEEGYQPESKVLDAPVTFNLGWSQHYTPRNYDGNFHGLMTIRQALAMSLNVPAVKTLSRVGVPTAIAMAHRLGITTLNDPNRYGLSLVLGGGEVKLLDETAGYSVFANDGKKNTPTSLLKVVDNQGKIYYTPTSENAQVLDPQIARKIDSILSDNKSRVPMFGPNNKLFIPGKIVAAKTGTTSAWKDAWTVGFTPDIATGVWAGNNNNRPMHAGADGSFVAAPIWNKFMVQALKNQPAEPFLTYTPSSEDPPIDKNLSDTGVNIVYFIKRTGEIISAKKAARMDPEKIGMRFDNNADQTNAGQSNADAGNNSNDNGNVNNGFNTDTIVKQPGDNIPQVSL